MMNEERELSNKTLDLTTLQALVIDMDGVLWRGETLLPGFHELFQFLEAHQITFMLATNNARKTPTQYLARFAKFGLTLTRDHLLTSSLATAIYLQRELPPQARVYVVGEDGLREALQEVGFTLVEDATHSVEAVVAGLDFEFSYQKLKMANLFIRQGARFIGSNGDVTFPIEGMMAPGAGSILAAIEAASGVAPTVVGKPARLMFEVAVQKMGANLQHTAMLGDRLDTDILGGQQAGLKTILVTSGVDNEASMQATGIQPDAVFSGIDELVRVWQASL